MKRTADEGRRVVAAEEIPAADVPKTDRELLLGRRVVRAEEILAEIERGEPVKYENVIVEGDLDLDNIGLRLERIKLHPDLISPEFGAVEYDVKCVKSIIEIKDCDLKGSVNFAKAIFHEVVDFTETVFYGRVDFGQTVFCKETIFAWTHFHKRAVFYMARFKGNAIFGYNFGHNNGNGAKFNEDATFGHAIFEKQSDFFNTQFNRSAVFFRAQFFENAYFDLARFEDEIQFIDAKFNKWLELNGTKINRITLFFICGDVQISLRQSQFNRFSVPLAQIKKLEASDEDRLALINNFKNMGLFEDADKFYYEYRKSKMMEKGRSYWSRLYDIISFLSCGYGVRPDFTLIIIGTIIFLSGLLFLGSGHSIWECFYFSIMTFAGNGPDNLELTSFLRIVEVIEAISGYLFLALLVIVLARKFIR